MTTHTRRAEAEASKRRSQVARAGLVGKGLLYVALGFAGHQRRHRR